jgi:hypothetical protein
MTLEGINGPTLKKIDRKIPRYELSEIEYCPREQCQRDRDFSGDCVSMRSDRGINERPDAKRRIEREIP